MEADNRLRRIQRNQYLLLGFLIVAVPVTAWLASMRSQSGQIVQCERLEIKDAEGGVLAVLGVDAEGSIGLFLNDDQGVLRLSLSHDPDQSALFIRDAQGTVRVGVAQFAHGGGGLALHGADSKGAAVLYYKNGGSLSFYNEAGATTYRLPPKAE